MVVAYIFVLHSSHLAADGSDKIRIADPQVSFQEEFTESVNYIKETTASVRQIEHKQSSRYIAQVKDCLLYTSPSPRDATLSRMPSSA